MALAVKALIPMKRLLMSPEPIADSEVRQQVLTNVVTGEVELAGGAHAKCGAGVFGFKAAGLDSSSFLLT